MWISTIIILCIAFLMVRALKDDWFISGLVIVVALLFILIGWGAVKSQEQREREIEACRLAGGVPTEVYRGMLCFTPGVVQEVPRANNPR